MNKFEELSQEDYQTLISDSQSFLQDYIKYQLQWNTIYRYLVSPVIGQNYSSFSIHVKSVEFANDVHLTRELYKQDPDVTYRDTVTIECEISVWTNRNPADIQTVQHTFELPFEYTVNELRRVKRLEIFDKQSLLLHQTDDLIFTFYEENLGDEQILFGRSGIQVRFEKACYRTPLHQPFIPLYKWLELTRCLQRFRFAIANANLRKPYLDNPEWHGHWFQSGMVYPSYPTLHDERYFIQLEIAYEALYKFWDRIGDRLHDVVDSGLPIYKVDFAQVIDHLNRSGLYANNPGFQWLLSFKQNEYAALNLERKNIVHYDTLSSKMQDEHMNAFTDLNKIRERQQWLDSRIDYFTKEFNNCIEGLEQLTVFIENLPPRQDPNENL